MHLASCLQRLPHEQRWQIAEALLTHEEDADDENIPLLVWYAIEPLVIADRDRFIALAGKTSLPIVANHIARRAASGADLAVSLNALVKLLSTTKGEVQSEFLSGIITGLEGRRTVSMRFCFGERRCGMFLVVYHLSRT